MQKVKSQTGSAHAVIIIVLVIALLGVLGFVFWNNFLKKEPAAQTEPTPTAREFCSDGENTTATEGIFCSQEMGIKFDVPSIFTNKLTKADNYQVFQGPLDPNSKTSAGMSENVYRATISGTDNFTFTIAQEPLRTGYVDVEHKLQGTYYDQATSELTLVNAPTRQYDSATETTTTTGTLGKGEVVPSFNVGDVRVFKGKIGDAGQVKNTYFAVIKGKIIKITLLNEGYIGNPDNDPTTIDASKVFEELDTALKSLKVS